MPLEGLFYENISRKSTENRSNKIIMENFKELLHKFETLEEIQKIAGEFQNGYSKEEIEKLFESTNLTPTQEFIELYCWHDGMKNNFEEKTFEFYGGNMEDIYVGVNLFSMATFLPLKRSILYYHLTKEYAELLPFFVDDNVLSINLDISSKNYGKIYIQNNAVLIIEPMPIFNSLKDMFFTFFEAFNSKISYFELDNDGFYLEEDYEEKWELCKKHNVGCVYWDGDNDTFLNYTYLK